MPRVRVRGAVAVESALQVVRVRVRVLCAIKSVAIRLSFHFQKLRPKQVCMMYSLYCRKRIVKLAERLNAPDIVKVLDEEGLSVTVRGVYYVIARHKKTNSVFDAPRSGRPSVVSTHAREVINQSLQDNDELITRDLLEKLKNLDLGGSLSSVARARRKLGWTSTATRYCQMIRQANKEKRVDFCKQVLEAGDNFDDVIFTDEAMVQLVSCAEVLPPGWTAKKVQTKAQTSS